MFALEELEHVVDLLVVMMGLLEIDVSHRVIYMLDIIVDVVI